MNTTLKLVMNAALVIAALTLTACGSSTGTGGGTGGTGGTGGAGGGSGGGTGGGTATDGGSGTTCAAYCTSIQGACLTGLSDGGSNAQYASQADCVGACAGFTAGTVAETSGNTKECRAYHAGVAAGATADKGLHCPHAGPAGDGACGTNCEGFCAVAASACPGTFADAGVTCATACAAFTGVTARYNSSTTSGNSFSCRMYHLSVAAGGATAAATHCPHIKPVSSTCN